MSKPFSCIINIFYTKPVSHLGWGGAGQVRTGVQEPGLAAPLPVLSALMLLLVVDLQQVLLHAVGDLWAQVPDKHTATETRSKRRGTKYG